MPIIRKESLDVEFVVSEIKKNKKAMSIFFPKQPDPKLSNSMTPPYTIPETYLNKIVRPVFYININGDYIDIGNPRFIAFLKGETKCFHCDLEGTFFAKEKDNPKAKHFHLHLYAIDPETGKDVLINYLGVYPFANISRVTCSKCLRKLIDQKNKYFMPPKYAHKQNRTSTKQQQKPKKQTPQNNTPVRNVAAFEESFSKPFSNLLKNIVIPAPQTGEVS
jgi:hypothetical protein